VSGWPDRDTPLETKLAPYAVLAEGLDRGYRQIVEFYRGDGSICRGNEPNGPVPLVRSEQLLPLVYDELRKLTAAKMAEEKLGQTLQATGLLE